MIDLIFKFFPNLIKQRDRIIDEARQKAKQSILDSQEELARLSSQVARLQKTIAKEEAGVQIQKTEISIERKHLQKERNRLEQEKIYLERRKAELIKKFEKLTNLTREEAREALMAHWEQKLSSDIVKRIQEAEEQVKKEAEKKAQEILVDAMRYGATDYVVEYTLSTIDLPNEDFKGRIIGKEGRNIRSFELATGVEIDLDEEGVIKISSFDPVKREIARVSLNTLIKDGRIQPSRIEEVVKKTKEEIDKIIYKEGEKISYELGVYNLPQEIIKLLGCFKFRFSFGQSLIQHTLEETRIGIALAHELKANVNVVRLACLLHDIGKVIKDKEGSHVLLGADLLRKHRFPQEIIDAVESHHEDKPFNSVEGVIVYLADAISGSRPGARREDVTQYIKRIQEMESFIKGRGGVLDVAVLQAGREIRVIIDPRELDDDQTVIFCEKLKDDLMKHYSSIPGQIKITAIREFRTTKKTRS